MAIRIPILTSFDPKGLKQANAQFGKLQTSIGSLGRNFAAAGIAIAAAGAVIAKNAQSLARIERINAQTAQTIKSMGNASNISATQVEALAGSLENLTATEAETIQEGANLLLTFKNIQNQAGAGNDIFNQTTAAMVDVARAMGTNASTEAIRLGKALNDPIKGISALSRVGIQFTEDQKAQIKALQQSGDLMGAQKIILAELQSQFGGSGAAYAKTLWAMSLAPSARKQQWQLCQPCKGWSASLGN
jgi:phage-related minor tail protein